MRQAGSVVGCLSLSLSLSLPLQNKLPAIDAALTYVHVRNHSKADLDKTFNIQERGITLLYCSDIIYLLLTCYSQTEALTATSLAASGSGGKGPPTILVAAAGWLLTSQVRCVHLCMPHHISQL